ncbi:MAG: FtsW/RodA/SpoVE family cell cycle protein [Saprospiraceae bacterium]|nr:FtsW/RodA/SpoVE family cell cycle protein [Saprospiraceae bacterium]
MKQTLSLKANFYNELKGDLAIWLVIALLAAFSLMAIYSSTETLAYKERGGNTEYYLIKHFLILAVGLCFTYVCHLMYYMRYSILAPLLLYISIGLLICTLLFGPEVNDARRWLAIPGIGITFQSSDLAKIALIIYIARSIAFKQDYIKDFGSAFVPIIVPVLIVCGLIAPADLSSAVILFVTCLTMMFIGRVDMKYISILIVFGIMLLAALIGLGYLFPEFIRVETWTSRINEFVNDPVGGYQIEQAKIAIAEGGWFGVGPGQSTQDNFLPSPYADFIYAIICEEYGLLGGATIILLYLFLVFRCMRLVTRSPKTFGAMLSIGLCLSLVLQAFMHIAISVHLVPVTGLTLPMVSMGGTSIIFTCISFGIILSVSKYIEKVKEKSELAMAGS